MQASAVAAVGIAVTLLFACTAVEGANVYKCKDAKGAISFSDAPCATDQNTVDHKVTNDANTLGKQPSKSGSKDSRSESRSSRPTTTKMPASAGGATASTGDSGCDGQRKRLAKLQTQSCIEGLQIATGRVMCMPEAERREYLSRLKTTIEAVCS